MPGEAVILLDILDTFYKTFSARLIEGKKSSSGVNCKCFHMKLLNFCFLIWRLYATCTIAFHPFWNVNPSRKHILDIRSEMPISMRFFTRFPVILLNI